MDESLDDLDDVAQALADADTAVAFTGAGVSTASGIPSFRGEDGIWETEFDPDSFHVSRFRTDPEGFWRDRLDLQEAMFPDHVAPNAAHDALAALEAEGYLDGVITQNTDGLHREAGSEHVVELHGNASRVACQRCGRTADAASAIDRVRRAVGAETGADDQSEAVRDQSETVREQGGATDHHEAECPPTCANCGGILKPDVVLFGEQLPDAPFSEAQRLARESDVFLVIGSSLEVEPAASLPRRANQTGTTVLVNLEETPFSDDADYEFRADVTEVLPALAERVIE